MLCKKCGTQIRKEDKREDGLYECPGCGTVYRAKKKMPSDSSAANSPKPISRQKKRGERRSHRSWIIGGILVVSLAVALFLLLPGKQTDTKATAGAILAASATANVSASPTAAPSPTPPPPASVHFRAVGDVMSHKLQMTHAHQSDGSFNYDSQFEYVKDALSKADFTIANLELSIAVDDDYSSFPFFRAPEAILATLKDCEVDLLTMANNHILDGFFDGLTHTVDKAEEYGFEHVGAYRSAEEAAQPLVIDINGIRFGFLAYTKDLNDNDKRIDANQSRFCAKRLSEADFERDVQELRDLGAEVVICLPHWGEEGKRSVPADCKRYAQRMVEAGVDIILGSHPHVVLPIDTGEMEVNGENKDILIAWSMGNFISYMAARYMDSGIIVDFTVTRDETGKIHIHDVGYVPVYVWGSKSVFHLLCSGDFYQQRPNGMSDDTYKRMKQSVREIVNMIGQDGVTLLQN